MQGSQCLTLAITHIYPSNGFYAIAAESKKKSVTDRLTDRPTCSKLALLTLKVYRK